MSSPIVRNFMKQQGFAEKRGSICDMHFAGLSFQPGVLGLLVVIAISALLFAKLCLGSYIYHLVCGNISFANSTLPGLIPALIEPGRQRMPE